MDKLTQYKRRLENPEYHPSDHELEQFGKLKNAIESMLNAAQKEKQDRGVRPISRTPWETRRKIEKAFERARDSRLSKDKRLKAKEDVRVAIEDMENQIQIRQKGKGLGGVVGGLFRSEFDRMWDKAGKENTKEMIDDLKRFKVYYSNL